MKVLIVAEGKHELSGALETLVRKLGGDHAEFEFDHLSNPCIHTHGKGRCCKRALGWLREAKKRGSDALVLLLDEDSQSERISQLTEAQNSVLFSLRRALGVAIKTFDAWMLADETALTTVLGHQVDTQPDPESLRNPKKRCEDLLAESPNRMAQRDMYAAIARETDIGTLSKRCPRGFVPFANHVRAIFQ